MSPKGRRFSLNRPDEYNSRSRVSSIGYWSVLHTGIQNLQPWRTMDLGGGVSNVSGPPDWLLLDLLGATYPMQHDQWRINSTLPDEFSTVSFMNSTAGQVNLNSKIYPQGNQYFQAPPRRAPLEAVFKNLRSDSELNDLLDGIDAVRILLDHLGDAAHVSFDALQAADQGGLVVHTMFLIPSRSIGALRWLSIRGRHPDRASRIQHPAVAARRSLIP